MHANVSVIRKAYCDGTKDMLTIRTDSSTTCSNVYVSVLIRWFTCPCFSYQNDPVRTKSFVSQKL